MEVHLGDKLLSMCVREFLDGINEEGRQTSNVVGARPWAGALDRIKKKVS